MAPRNACIGPPFPPAHVTPPPFSHPMSNVKENAPLETAEDLSSRYLIWMLSSLWNRSRLGLPRTSAPKYELLSIEMAPVGRYRTCRPRPGCSLNMPYDCHPLMIHGSILSLSLV